MKAAALPGLLTAWLSLWKWQCGTPYNGYITLRA